MIIKGRDGFQVEVPSKEIIKAGFLLWIGGMIAYTFFNILLSVFDFVIALFQLRIMA
jgi:hypothetical protein